jgi:hypothetical protein
MRYRVIAVLLVTYFAPLAQHAQTQREMNEDACAAYKKADAAEKHAVAEVKRRYVKDRQFLKRFASYEQAWSSMRKMYLNARWPAADSTERRYGSVFPMCRCSEAATKVALHTKEIVETWLDRDSGDVCLGEPFE